VAGPADDDQVHVVLFRSGEDFVIRVFALAKVGRGGEPWRDPAAPSPEFLRRLLT